VCYREVSGDQSITPLSLEPPQHLISEEVDNNANNYTTSSCAEETGTEYLQEIGITDVFMTYLTIQGRCALYVIGRAHLSLIQYKGLKEFLRNVKLDYF
jgi:hypothetical protein